MSAYASGKYSQGICSRCKMKVPYLELREDGNIPGLYVCGSDGCHDKINPYKLPAREIEGIALEHPRPDVPLAPVTPYLVSDGYEYYLLDDDGNPLGI